MASLKDLLVTGTARILGKIYAGGFVGNLTGNADSATKASKDSANQQINSTYIKSLSVNGRTITITKGDNSTSSITTQDTNSWRGIQDNLTSTATDQSLSANQGRVLKSLVDGKASSGHGHYLLNTIGDKRSESTTPRSYANNMIFQGLKNSSTIGSPASSTYSYLLGLKGWSDDSGGKAHELAFNDKGIYHRTGTDSGGWGNWSRVITSAIGDPVYVSKNTPTEPCIWVKLD